MNCEATVKYKDDEEGLVATGRCPMCLRDGQNIQDSHYLPKGAYKGFRAPSLKNPNPVVVTSTRMDQTSLQIHDYVLCWDCEQVLNKKGEDWVLPMLAGEEGFPLFNLLKKEIPMLTEHDLDTYACSQIAGIDWEKLAHFGMGMFWKGAAHAWPGCAKLKLGGYAEEIRRKIPHISGTVTAMIRNLLGRYPEGARYPVAYKAIANSK